MERFKNFAHDDINKEKGSDPMIKINLDSVEKFTAEIVIEYIHTLTHAHTHSHIHTHTHCHKHVDIHKHTQIRT